MVLKDCTFSSTDGGFTARPNNDHALSSGRVRDLRSTFDQFEARKNQGSPSAVAIVETSPTPDPSPSSSPLEYDDAPHTAPVYNTQYAESSHDLHVQSRRSLQGSSLPGALLDGTDLVPPKVQHQRDRSQQISRANKLAKMGFSATAEHPPTNTGSRPVNNKLRFGGIKHLVDSIKGKR